MQELPWFLTHTEPELLYTDVKGYFVVLDFETDSNNFGDPLDSANDVVLACWQKVHSHLASTVHHKFGNIYEQHELLADIAGADFVVCHNAKFEAQWLKNCGIELRDVLFCDTMLMAWVLDGNQRKPRGLNALAQRYKLGRKLDLISKMIDIGVPPRWIPDRWLLEYCHLDVELTKQLFLAMSQDVSANSLWHLVHVRNLTCAALADIEFEGLVLDEVLVDEEYNKALTTRDELETQLTAMTGGINLGSPVQLATFLYDTLGFAEALDNRGKPIRTDSGKRSADSKTLAKLKATSEQQSAFLSIYKEYNKAASLLEKNLEFFKGVCAEYACKFFGIFNQNIVASHRLSSSGRKLRFTGSKVTKGIQLQNIPREFKKLFWSGDDEWDVMEGDGGQLEFRVAADMCNDTVAKEEIEAGVDVHAITAQVLTEAGEPTSRQDAKASTFKPINKCGLAAKAALKTSLIQGKPRTGNPEPSSKGTYFSINGLNVTVYRREHEDLREAM